MPDELGIKSYIDAFTVSSNRVRSVLILITITSILVFAAFWNSTPVSWMNSRLEVARAALNAHQHGWTKEYIDTLSGEDRRLYYRAAEWMRSTQMTVNDPKTHASTETQLKDMVNEFNKVRTENSLIIRVPFFGVVIDINDLGLIGGFTFCILLLWFKFSLTRELSNLKLAFLAAHESDQVSATYDLVAMRQVLNAPDIRQQDDKHKEQVLIKLLYWLPAMLQIAVIGIDVKTFGRGWSVNPLDVIVVYFGSLVSLGLILRLTWQCAKLSSAIDGVWLHEATQLGIVADSADVKSAGANQKGKEAAA